MHTKFVAFFKLHVCLHKRISKSTLHTYDPLRFKVNSTKTTMLANDAMLQRAYKSKEVQQNGKKFKSIEMEST